MLQSLAQRGLFYSDAMSLPLEQSLNQINKLKIQSWYLNAQNSSISECYIVFLNPFILHLPYPSLAPSSSTSSQSPERRK